MPGPAFATGDSVSLHPIEEEDHEFVQYGRNHPESRVPLADSDIRTLEDVAAMLENRDHHYLVCASEGDDGGEDRQRVGVVSFGYTRPGEFASLMYWTAPEHRRQGYISEALELFLDYAFRECGFHKVTARVMATNEASAGVLESLGFKREGTFAEQRFVDGEWVDAHQYGLLARQWLD